MSLNSVITQIATGAVKLWHEAEADIEADYAKIKAALPASAQPTLDATIADIKQGASDALTMVSGGIAGAAPALTKAMEAALDGAMASLTNGVAVPLVPIVNSGIDNLETLAVATIQSWILKQKASLAPPVATKS